MTPNSCDNQTSQLLRSELQQKDDMELSRKYQRTDVLTLHVVVVLRQGAFAK